MQKKSRQNRTKGPGFIVLFRKFVTFFHFFMVNLNLDIKKLIISSYPKKLSTHLVLFYWIMGLMITLWNSRSSIKNSFILTIVISLRWYFFILKQNMTSVYCFLIDRHAVLPNVLKFGSTSKKRAIFPKPLVRFFKTTNNFISLQSTKDKNLKKK